MKLFWVLTHFFDKFIKGNIVCIRNHMQWHSSNVLLTVVLWKRHRKLTTLVARLISKIYWISKRKLSFFSLVLVRKSFSVCGTPPWYHGSIQGRPCTYKGDSEASSRNHIWRGRAISLTYSECVSVALVTQNAKHMRRITAMLWSVDCNYASVHVIQNPHKKTRLSANQFIYIHKLPYMWTNVPHIT